MGDVTLAIYRSRDSLEAFFFDAVIDPVVSRGLEVSGYPREDGTIATEHARIRPVVLRFRGLLVNEPTDDGAAQQRSNASITPTNTANTGPFVTYMGRDFEDPLVSARILGPQVDDNRAWALYTELTDIMEAREPVQVYTPAYAFSTALLREITQRPVGKAAYEVSGTIEQVRFANSGMVSLKPIPAPQRIRKSGGTTDVGAKGTTESPQADATKAKSALLSLAESAGVL